MVVVIVVSVLGDRELEIRRWRRGEGFWGRGEKGRLNLEMGWWDLAEEEKREGFEKEEEEGGATAAIVGDAELESEMIVSVVAARGGRLVPLIH